MRDKLQRYFNVGRDELLAVLLSALFFFFVLTALGAVRPAREALGVQRGIDSVRWLFVGTALVTLLVSPVFGLLVSRYRRLAFITATYLFFAVSLIVFFGLLELAPRAIGETTGQVFYVWFSVFNLFATMVFWALMADRFTLDQSKRLFGPIAAGGTLGAIFGPSLAMLLARPLGTPGLLLVGTLFLLLAIAAAWAVAHARLPRVHGVGTGVGVDTGVGVGTGVGVDVSAGVAVGIGTAGSDQADELAVIGGSAWEGLRAVARSRYLLGIAAYIVVLAVISTFLYFTRLQMVAALGPDTDMRATTFARIDTITQTATLILQLAVAGHLMRRVGVAVTLALLPATVALGFIGLAMVGSLAVLVAFEATFRAVQRAIMRPARETLFTVVSRADKYKSKAVIDTFGYRAGDVVGAWVEGLIARLGMGLFALASVAVPLAIAWGALGIWLGRQQPMEAGRRQSRRTLSPHRLDPAGDA